ncbi:MAG TPA: DUF1707 domain-containing protein [Gaiellaceae bacterium]|nr:DUF1707 domain-containing protein [Gaiellaceae bacterium]
MPEEPSDGGNAPALRVGDADRDRAATVLREHCVHGRLTLEEFSARLDELYRVRDDHELAAVLRDLPVAREGEPRIARRSWLITLIGSVQRRGPWRVARRLFGFSLLGAPDFDFRQAVIGDADVRIVSFSVIGALTAIVPAGIDVELHGFGLVGGNDLMTTEHVEPAPNEPRIRIWAFALIGGARVRQVRAELPAARNAALGP